MTLFSQHDQEGLRAAMVDFAYRENMAALGVCRPGLGRVQAGGQGQKVRSAITTSPATVKQIVIASGCSVNTVRKHLLAMLEAGVVVRSITRAQCGDIPVYSLRAGRK